MGFEADADGGEEGGGVADEVETGEGAVGEDEGGARGLGGEGGGEDVRETKQGSEVIAFDRGRERAARCRE